MKVSYLIKMLKHLDPNAEVRIGSADGDSVIEVEHVGIGEPPKGCLPLTPDDYPASAAVILGVSNLDLHKWLDEILTAAGWMGLEKEDAFAEYIDRGVTVEMVRQHSEELAKEFADYCRDHGLIC